MSYMTWEYYKIYWELQGFMTGVLGLVYPLLESFASINCLLATNNHICIVCKIMQQELKSVCLYFELVLSLSSTVQWREGKCWARSWRSIPRVADRGNFDNEVLPNVAEWKRNHGYRQMRRLRRLLYAAFLNGLYDCLRSKPFGFGGESLTIDRIGSKPTCIHLPRRRKDAIG